MNRVEIRNVDITTLAGELPKYPAIERVIFAMREGAVEVAFRRAFS
jgi:hypothetical protein